MTLLNREQIKEIYMGKVKPSPDFKAPKGWEYDEINFMERMHYCNMAILNYTPNYILNKVSILEARKLQEKK